MVKEVRKTWYFEQSPKDVWEYLTKPELLEQWLMKNDFKPVLGFKFQFTSPQGVAHYCQVLQIDPYSKLCYSWKKDNMPVASKVTWTLTAKNEGTELLLVHEAFNAQEDVTAHDKGWSILVPRMATLLATLGNKDNKYKEIRQIWHFSRSNQEVWEYLTQPNLLEQWLGKVNIKPEVGHKFQIVGKKDCITYCEVIEAVPYTRLAYTWQKESDKDDKPFSSIVTWTLTPKNGATELQLLHTGFPTIEDHSTHNNGWNLLSGQLMHILNTNEK